MFDKRSTFIYKTELFHLLLSLSHSPFRPFLIESFEIGIAFVRCRTLTVVEATMSVRIKSIC